MWIYPNGSTADFMTVTDRAQWFPIGSGDDVGAITIKPKEGESFRCEFLNPDREFVKAVALTHKETVIIDPRQTIGYSRCQSAYAGVLQTWDAYSG